MHFPHWRKMTWALVIWSLIALVGLAFFLSTTPGEARSYCGGGGWVENGSSSYQACVDDRTQSNAIGGTMFIAFSWLVVFIPMGLAWRATRDGRHLGDRLRAGHRIGLHRH